MMSNRKHKGICNSFLFNDCKLIIIDGNVQRYQNPDFSLTEIRYIICFACPNIIRYNEIKMVQESVREYDEKIQTTLHS